MKIDRARRPLGAAILAVVIVVVIVARMARGEDDPGPDAGLTVVHGYGGQLKANFLADPAVIAILADRYDLTVDIDVVGSIAMLRKACDGSLAEGDDFLWAGDQSTLAIYQGCGGVTAGADNIYNSPMVVYSWSEIVDALVAAGYAELQGDGSYSLDLPRLVEHMVGGGTWDALGLGQYHGETLVHTSDPEKSNSGYLFAGMLANILNGRNVVTTATVDPWLPEVAAYFGRLGFMEETSGELFEQFLTTGSGAKPLIASYESQLPEFLHANPSYQAQIGQEVRILYPEPTIWATHPLIARTEAGARLLAALKDPEIQALTWARHGQRPGVPGIPIDPGAMGIPGIRERITSVIDMPGPAVMERILEAISPAEDGGAADGGTAGTIWGRGGRGRGYGRRGGRLAGVESRVGGAVPGCGMPFKRRMRKSVSAARCPNPQRCPGSARG